MKTTKYLYFLLAAGLTLGACTNDTDVEENVPATPSEGTGIGFTTIVGDKLDDQGTENLDGEQTRSTINADFEIASWATSDKISVSDGVLNYTYQPKENTTGSRCVFEAKTGGNSFTTDGTGSEATFFAFYPADAVQSWNGSTVSTMIYTEQDYTENCENSGVMGPYMAAQATTTGGGANASFTFGHICSVIDVNLSSFDGGEVESVSLYANSQVSIAGRMKFNTQTKVATISSNDATDYSYSTQSEMVRVSKVNATHPVVRFYVLPVKQTNGFTITVRTTDGKYYTKTSTTSVGNTDANSEYLSSVSGVTNGTVCLPYYKKYNFGSKSTARTQNWMAMIPGNVKFNHLSIPGTHDAATSGCTSQTNYTKTQEFTVAEQLAKGCRALDLRPYYNSSDLTIYHGSYTTNTNLATVLTATTDFLDANPTETVFILIAQEGGDDGNTNWQNRVWDCLNNYSSHIASHGWTGNLNPCRGKMVIIFRNTYTGGTNSGDLGCGKVGWGSSFNPKSIATGNGSGTYNTGTLYYQDEYEYTSSSYVNEKLSHLENMLNNYIAANETNASNLYVNNTNAIKGTSIFGTVVVNTNLTTTAQNINTAVLGSTTFTGHNGKFGIMMTDFLFSSSQKGDQMFELIHQQNYKYVYKGRTRYTTSGEGTDTGIAISGDEYADDSQVYVKGEKNL